MYNIPNQLTFVLAEESFNSLPHKGQNKFLIAHFSVSTRAICDLLVYTIFLRAEGVNLTPVVTGNERRARGLPRKTRERPHFPRRRDC